MAARGAQKRRTAARKARQVAVCREFERREGDTVREVFGAAAVEKLRRTRFRDLTTAQQQFMHKHYAPSHAR